MRVWSRKRSWTIKSCAAEIGRVQCTTSQSCFDRTQATQMHDCIEVRRTWSWSSGTMLFATSPQPFTTILTVPKRSFIERAFYESGWSLCALYIQILKIFTFACRLVKQVPTSVLIGQVYNWLIRTCSQLKGRINWVFCCIKTLICRCVELQN